ncbi:uncharacterized protein EURHEDRAFT_411328 [Aspergillus ruber CBS 135680]|uniref:Secreted protein n=1 Tax=Aspergillus ruber (strain CBS 135680) TaxID=1388766 RepID=A0A017SGV8_ASPRC|nr:uncharacterized protein EURHEDRAFT_411328 [Aspergillus ruber CBS 135680]EYE96182.1 hypothetical protein EURHEDRAFT_411328 [Aspergillus ruber CBS 135680]
MIKACSLRSPASIVVPVTLFLFALRGFVGRHPNAPYPTAYSDLRPHHTYTGQNQLYYGSGASESVTNSYLSHSK